MERYQMSNTGSPSNFIDVQDGKLVNVTDDKNYQQLNSLNLNIDSNVTKHHLTDDTIDNVFSLYLNSIEGNMILTTMEWNDLVTLTRDVDGVRPTKIWRLEWQDVSGDIVHTSFNGQLQTLRPTRPNAGLHEVYFQIQADEAISIVVNPPREES